MSYSFTRDSLAALEVTARTAAAYLDACDTGLVRRDPSYYLACGNLLVKILSLVNVQESFPSLLERSPAVLSITESIQIGRRLELDTRLFYPELAALLNRAARL